MQHKFFNKIMQILQFKHQNHTKAFRNWNAVQSNGRMLVEVRCKTGKEKSFRPSASNHINLLPGPESALHIWLCAKRETFVISLNVKRIHFFYPLPSTPCTLSSTLFPMNIGTTTRSPCALPLPSFYLPSTAPTGKKCHRGKRHQLELSSSSMYF